MLSARLGDSEQVRTLASVQQSKIKQLITAKLKA